jgi:nitrogen regulatory protein P-II 1
VQLISAIVRTSKVDAICEALQTFGFHGLTVTDAIGLGKQKGPTEIYRGLRHSSAFQQASKLEIVTRDDDVADLVDVICRVAATGRLGDGKVWITPVRELVRIRTREMGEDALQ